MASPVQVIAHGDATHKPYGVAVDSQYIYWASQQFGGAGCASGPTGSDCSLILRANLDGSNVVTISADFDTVVFPRDVVLNGDYVYWNNSGSSSSGLPAVARCPKSGCLAAPEVFPRVATQFTYGSGLAVSDAGIFWLGSYNDTPASNGVAELWRIDPTDGGAAGPIARLPGGGSDRAGMLASSEKYVYFAYDDVGSVQGVAYLGGDAPILAADAGLSSLSVVATCPYSAFGPGAFAVDTAEIYFSSTGCGLLAAPRDGVGDAGATRLTSGSTVTVSLVDDGSSVFWTQLEERTTDGGTEYGPTASIFTCPTSGCPTTGPRSLASGVNVGPSGYLAIDATYLYVSIGGDGTIGRVAK